MGLFPSRQFPAQRAIPGELRTSWIALATFVALVALSVALIGAFDHAITAADAIAREDERTMVNRSIARALEAQARTQVGLVNWDEAVRHAVLAPDPVWMDQDFGVDNWSALDAERAILVQPDGTMVRAWHRGRMTPNAGLAALRPAIRQLIAQSVTSGHTLASEGPLRRLADGTPWPVSRAGQMQTRWAGGLVQIDGEVMTMVAVAITPDHDPALMRRMPDYLVSMRPLQKVVAGRMRQDLVQPDLALASAPPVSLRENALALIDVDGGRIGWLRWRARAIGRAIMQRTAPILAVWIVLFFVVIAGGWMILRRTGAIARELRASEAQARHNALHDAMSGLPNRVQTMQRLRQDLAACIDGRLDGDIFVAYIDLDGFKLVNDTLGHHVGDELVRQTALRLRHWLAPGDFIARFGGDEFVVLRRGVGGRAMADRLGEEIIALMREPFTITGSMIDVTCSCGISWGPAQSEDPGELLRRADIALYRAKQRGRGRYRRFTRDMDASVKLRLDMEVELRRAIALDELSVAYQPIVRTADGSVVGVEALLRWHHPERGPIRPDMFVPIAEQAGLMIPLGNWMLAHVFAECRDWPDCDISVNLSPLQIMARDFVATMGALVQRSGIDPHRVVLEITEGVMLDRSERVIEVLRDLNRMGFRIALDDFGIGYSSLSYLRSFQFDRIKIDRSFVSNIESDSDAHAILCTIVSLGHSLRMKVVAEGVETETQRRLVQAAGCELVQGFLFWKAMPAAEVRPLLGMPQADRALRSA